MKVKKSIKDSHLFKKGQRVIVCVSGGPDSVALLHVLNELKYALGIRLSVAHYNHRLRKDSDRDEAFVNKLAEKLNIPCQSAARKGRRHPKSAIEDSARRERYSFFISLAQRKKAALALGHTRDDLAETVLMRLVRGSGIKGLRAIMPKRKMKEIDVIRPMLGAERKDVLVYLKKKNLPFRMDKTNRDRRFTRNRIRHDLLPKLAQDYNPGIKVSLCHLAETAWCDYDFLETEAAGRFRKSARKSRDGKSVKFPIGYLKRQHVSILRLLLRLSIEEVHGSTKRLTMDNIDSVIQPIRQNTKKFTTNLPSSIRISIRNNTLSIKRNP